MQNRMSVLKTVVVVGLLAGLGTGCGVELGGKEGNLKFHYRNAGQESGVRSGAIAVGAKVDIEARQSGDSGALQIVDAYSEAAEFVDVVAKEKFFITVEGAGEGTAEIGVVAKDGSEEVEDFVDIRSGELKRIDLGHNCAGGVYLKDGRATFNYRMYDGEDKRLTGYGLYPVEVEPAEGGQVYAAYNRLGLVAIDLGDEPGEYEVVGDLVSEPLRYKIVGSEELRVVEFGSEAEVDGEDGEGEEKVEVSRSIATGSEAAIALLGFEVEDKPVCGSVESALEMTTSTPEICELSYSNFGGLHLVEARGLKEGDCEVTLSVPGTDFEQDYTVDII